MQSWTHALDGSIPTERISKFQDLAMSRQGSLSDYFEGVAAKKLSAVEADPQRSNQHEFNGVTELKKLLGEAHPIKFPTRFIWLGEEQEAIAADGNATWYDARDAHPTRSEYRLYFPTTPVSALAKEGDTLFVAKRTDGSLLIVLTPSTSTIESQLSWLFGLKEKATLKFEVQQVEGSKDAALDFAARYILDELGVEPEEPPFDEIDKLIEPFGLVFPNTKELSDLARASLKSVSALDDPDGALITWLEREEALFRRLERRIVAKKIETGFMEDGNADVDGFVQFSLGVQNRRKSRAGRALEHHLAAIFTDFKLKHERGPETENKNKPDFLFPGGAEYRDPAFPAGRLTLLGAKSTLKDRWRQVLAEANRIPDKHLLTLEPRISENQTEQMKASRLTLVVPAKLHETYRPSQRPSLLKLSEFIALITKRQGA
jgi:hypothetical protein